MLFLLWCLLDGYLPTHQGMEVLRPDCSNGRDDGLLEQGIWKLDE